MHNITAIHSTVIASPRVGAFTTAVVRHARIQLAASVPHAPVSHTVGAPAAVSNATASRRAHTSAHRRSTASPQAASTIKCLRMDQSVFLSTALFSFFVASAGPQNGHGELLLAFCAAVMSASKDPVRILLDAAAAVHPTENYSAQRKMMRFVSAAISSICHDISVYSNGRPLYIKAPKKSIAPSSPDAQLAVLNNLLAKQTVPKTSSKTMPKRQRSAQAPPPDLTSTSTSLAKQANIVQHPWLVAGFSNYTEFVEEQHRQMPQNRNILLSMIGSSAHSPYIYYIMTALNIEFAHKSADLKPSNATSPIQSDTSYKKENHISEANNSNAACPSLPLLNERNQLKSAVPAEPLKATQKQTMNVINLVIRSGSIPEYVSLVSQHQLHDLIDLNQIQDKLLSACDIGSLIELFKSAKSHRMKMYNIVEARNRSVIMKQNSRFTYHLGNQSKACAKLMKHFNDNEMQSATPYIDVLSRQGAALWIFNEIKSTILLEQTMGLSNYSDLHECYADTLEVSLMRTLPRQSQLTERESQSIISFFARELASILYKNPYTNEIMMPILCNRFPNLFSNPIGPRNKSSLPPTNPSSLAFYTCKSPIKFVATTADLAELQADIPDIIRIAIDAEWDSSDESDVALFQIATVNRSGARKIYLIDMIEIDTGKLAPLIASLFSSENVTTIGFHSSGDISKLLKCLPNGSAHQPVHHVDLVVACKTMFPSQIAASENLSGKKLLSLSDLTKAVLGTTLDKRVRMSIWSKRPLRECQIIYAAGDVEVLLDLYDVWLETKDKSAI